MPSQCWRTVLAKWRKGLEATARRPATPPVKFSFGKLALGVCVNGLESLTKTHRAAKFSVGSRVCFAGLLIVIARPGCYCLLGVPVENDFTVGARVMFEMSIRFFQTPPSQTAIDA